jgi:2-keto-4-pentenoate hydratase/2-oxohepta-3-ene-1,7-dioic acid hydratase (catechol pathway)
MRIGHLASGDFVIDAGGVVAVRDAAQARSGDGPSPDLPESVEDVIVDANGARAALRGLLDWLHTEEGAAVPRVAPEGIGWRSPVERPGKIVCVGLNYHDHAHEVGLTPPTQPLLFAKLPSAVTGCGAGVRMPSMSSQLDYEAELAVVIGRRAVDVAEGDAYGHVAGYTVMNDVSVRDVMFGDGQWLRGKSLDTHAPLGPWLVTPDELADPMRLAIETLVNGEPRQRSSTGEMIFSVPALISYISHHFTLDPGDVIATGTPAGVGLAMDPPRFLRVGDIVDVTIEGLGTLTNRIIDHPVAAERRSA